ncbi:hemicentin-2-like [Penaeus japonicus]|uniref:hemicentin-2-like n=1 Tax=Penaeus japonicus TaxID=27405 RepID=UPI001C71574D|nr:hemicentin-2-like [Penaeus japonicus]
MIGWPWGSGQAPTSQWAATYYVILASVFLLSHQQQVSGEASVQLPETNVAGVAGAPGKLPCVVTHNTMGGAPVLVLWYKDGARMPFYTLDLREGEDREVFVDKSMQGRVHSDEPGTYLTLDKLQGQDSGRYKCRVDFENSPTLSALVNLTVYVVPSRLQVLDSNNTPVSAGFYGPLVEGNPLTLYCVATGGWPTPQVSWWKGSLLLANHSVVIGENNDYLHREVMNDGMGGLSNGLRQVKTKLMIPKIPRDFVHANLTCQASNNNITEPLSTTLSLNVMLRPSSVEIKSSGSPLVEGRQARIECVAVGAYPSAELSWEKLQSGQKTELQAPSRNFGDQTSSYLVMMPKAEDHGATLTCTARNPKIQNAEVTNSTRLQVHFAPRVSLRLAASLGKEPITEGKDVYFECEVASNPESRDIIWHHNGERVEHQLKSGILVSSSNLVLQMVRRTSAGNYTCTAVNTLGATTSNVVPLHIRYLPVCVDTPQTVAVAEGEDVRLTCRVDAQPEDDLEFTWYFNNTLDTVEVERHRVQVRAGHSFLDYTPRSARDYGTLSCWAHNTVGTQADPCRFTVVEAGM